MTGIIITTHNRPEYLRQCFDSLLRADLTDCKIYIVDDASRHETLRLIKFFRPSCEVVIIGKRLRAGIKDSLITGFQSAFNDCEIVINLDADAIVRNDFVKVLTSLKKRFPNNIITGFNCLTKNKDGSERHKIIEQGEGYNIKKSVGGINMVLDKQIYEKDVLPALKTPAGNWDHMACINSGSAVCAVPSVVQHIGHISAMGHHLGAEPIDVADDFKALYLPGVTLVGISTNNAEGLKKAAEISSKNVIFGDTILITSGVKIKSKEDYSRYVLTELVNQIKTSHFLIIQPDGYLLNYKAWTDEFLNYDYIGAVWNWYRDSYRVGNGGFSLRSKRLHEVLRDDKKIIPSNDKTISNFEEDHNIARIYREYLEKKHKIVFAPENIARKFSIEAFRNPDRKYRGQLGFHGMNVDFRGANIDHIPYLNQRHGSSSFAGFRNR